VLRVVPKATTRAINLFVFIIVRFCLLHYKNRAKVDYC
jgi:hypothetical protein